jgi:hypothetical protein
MLKTEEKINLQSFVVVVNAMAAAEHSLRKIGGSADLCKLTHAPRGDCYEVRRRQSASSLVRRSRTVMNCAFSYWLVFSR